MWRNIPFWGVKSEMFLSVIEKVHGGEGVEGDTMDCFNRSKEKCAFFNFVKTIFLQEWK